MASKFIIVNTAQYADLEARTQQSIVLNAVFVIIRKPLNSTSVKKDLIRKTAVYVSSPFMIQEMESLLLENAATFCTQLVSINISRLILIVPYAARAIARKLKSKSNT